MKKFTANILLILLSILIGFSVHSSVYAADDAKVEIWSYSLNERIEHIRKALCEEAMKPENYVYAIRYSG